MLVELTVVMGVSLRYSSPVRAQGFAQSILTRLNGFFRPLFCQRYNADKILLRGFLKELRSCLSSLPCLVDTTQ